MTTVIDQKTDCADSLASQLNRTARWRRSVQAKYPTDLRNGRAADALEKLANEAASGLSDVLFAELHFYNWASPSWHAALTAAASAAMASFAIRSTQESKFGIGFEW
jgi:hypothetical protein